MAIRVMLADDHKMLREALRTVLDKESDIEVVAEAGDGAETLRLLKEMTVDVVVMDISMPGVGGIEATRQVRASYPSIKVLALSTHFDRRFVLEMLEAGASGYVVKSSGSGELLRAIRFVSQGRTYLCPEIAVVVVDTVRGGNTAAAPLTGQEKARLGRRENEVLQMIAEGKTSPEISSRLHIATSTVEVHRRNIMRKLDLHTVAELTKYAIREGLTSG